MTKPYLGNEIDRSMAVAEHPIGRIGVPEDVAKAILLSCFRRFFMDYWPILPIDGGCYHEIITLIKLIEPNSRLEYDTEKETCT